MKTGFGSPLLEAMSRMLVPFMVLFAVYVVIHGHDSPGGGFQGGVILATVILLLRLVRGGEAPFGIGRSGALALACVGPALYAGIGLLAMANGGNFLDYGELPLSGDPAQIRAMGTLGIEIGVTLGVAGVVVVIFDALNRSGETG